MSVYQDNPQDKLLKIQKLINEAYRLGGGTYSGAAAKYGDGFHDLVKKRNSLRKELKSFRKIPVTKTMPSTKIMEKAQKVSTQKSVTTPASTEYSVGAKNPISAKKKNILQKGWNWWRNSVANPIADKLWNIGSDIGEDIYNSVPSNQVREMKIRESTKPMTHKEYNEMMLENIDPEIAEYMRKRLTDANAMNKPVFWESGKEGLLRFFDGKEMKAIPIRPAPRAKKVFNYWSQAYADQGYDNPGYGGRKYDRTSGDVYGKRGLFTVGQAEPFGWGITEGNAMRKTGSERGWEGRRLRPVYTAESDTTQSVSGYGGKVPPNYILGNMIHVNDGNSAFPTEQYDPSGNPGCSATHGCTGVFKEDFDYFMNLLDQLKASGQEPYYAAFEDPYGGFNK